MSKQSAKVILHHENRDPSDFTEFDGLRVVRPLRAILDLLAEERVSVEHIEQGFIDGVRKGIITLIEIENEVMSSNEKRTVNRWLKEIA